MVTLSADVTVKMMSWVRQKIHSGIYQSQGEVIRQLLREKMEKEELQDFSNWESESADRESKEHLAYLKLKGLL